MGSVHSNKQYSSGAVRMLHFWQWTGVFNHAEQTLILAAYQSTAVEAKFKREHH